jgi:hypothetical protein
MVLDEASAVEFMREALIKVSEDEIARIAADVEAKRARVAPALTPDALRGAGEAGMTALLRGAFVTRKRTDDILEAVDADTLSDALFALLHGDEEIEDRFTRFDEALEPVNAPVRREFGSELLRMLDPERYWLWARWLWNPATETGSLPLVLSGDTDLGGETAGEIYGKVGLGTGTVLVTADQLGFSRMRGSPFSVDVYLAGVYGVYLYAVTRMRMTQEFNRVIPQLPELLRRLFGVQYREV